MYHYYVVDAFTERAFGGNTAGVVLLEEKEFPYETWMLKVADELRYSETAFVRRQDDGVWHLRYFTPRAEVELCGHATIATFALLHSLGLASGPCRALTLAGELEVIAAPKVMMQMAKPRIISTIEATASVYDAVGIHGYEPELPVQVVSTGLPDIMLPVPSVEVLNTLQPNMEAIAALTAHYEAISIHPFALSDDGYTAHVRDFAPRCGVPEESATGTANAALTHFLAAHAVIAEGEHSFLQGEAMGRPSTVATRLDADGTVWVGGSAAIVAEGALLA
ncbi:MAG: PhzF family phenazine biosynthesis protein [Bacteroidales bacterium]|nr:PhzF family phenazine biosynthesis protein [Bacteroidales bacterium]